MSIAGAALSSSNFQKGLYRLIWRWHFYAGLLCLPLIISLSVSGCIYLFKPQLDAWVDAPYQHLTVSGQRTSANQQIGAALEAVPGARFSSYQLSEQDQQAVVVYLENHGEQVLVYLNPYSLEVLKTIRSDEQFVRQVRSFHGELLAGNTGSVMVELAACWAIVLVITGLYLWWPRTARGMAGVVYPRIGLGSRVFWRDLHAVTGIWISAMVLFLLISGLPWTLVWGSAFKELRQWSAPAVAQDWSVGRAEEQAHHHTGGSSDQVNLPQTLLYNAQALGFAPPVMLSKAKGDPKVWEIQSQSQNRPLRADAWLDEESGEVIRIQSFHERPLVDRIVGIGVAAHEGQLFGWFNQLLGVITATGLVVMSASGFILWRQCKPMRMLGAPPPLPDMRVGKTVTWIIILLAALLPLLAISIFAIVTLEWMVLRRFALSRKWLGLQAA